MRVLLDTHVLLWWLADAPELKSGARAVIADTTNELFVSAASAWEISIKRALGKLHAPANLESVVEKSGFSLLPIQFQHATKAGALPSHHQDPFDRMLVAQAMIEDMKLLTHNKQFRAYGIATIPV